MSFIRHKGKTKIMYFKKSDTANEVRDGSAVKINDSGSVISLDNDSTDRCIGVCRANDTITDTAFNSDGTQGSAPVGFVPVEVPVENAVEWLIDVDSDAGAADTDIGRYCAIDTEGGSSVNAGDSCATRVDISDTALPQVFITGRESASRIRGVLTKMAWHWTLDTHDTVA
jgi:hypothetical protein